MTDDARSSEDRPPDGGLLALAANRQMPDNARPNVTLGEVRAALAAAALAASRPAPDTRTEDLTDYQRGYVDGFDAPANVAARALAASRPAPDPDR